LCNAHVLALQPPVAVTSRIFSLNRSKFEILWQEIFEHQEVEVWEQSLKRILLLSQRIEVKIPFSAAQFPFGIYLRSGELQAFDHA
jgi:hypothetical protein